MLQIEQVHFTFPRSRFHNHNEKPITKTLEGINFNVSQGGLVAILGESGCGKSTLLDMIYGLLEVDQGKVIWKGEELLGPDHHLVPGHPMMKYVPQEFDLMPYTSVAENVGEHLSIQLDNRMDRIHELLEVVDMSAFAGRKVSTLSGGQKQRVAIAKALAQEPELLLLDEPFSHIDNFRKNHLRRRLFGYLKKQGISAMVATHDKEDVLSFCDQVIVMRHGKILDYRPTMQVYQNPKDLYTAQLFHEAQIIPGDWVQSPKDLIVYPYELSVADHGFEVVVMESYPTGRDYLILAQREGLEVFFKSARELEKERKVLLELVKDKHS
ncbi:ABC transporter ATP-binding protein [Nonlabens xiamenensis]|uniref:ABC transporter ATP-binding protein n=1 Tax=Nonlabens xiamenensis TaxID=2341043 RepID=UPI000F6133CB|nr:ATP-binding cassette domain-containing protein [Nonlabens xiamenensis]